MPNETIARRTAEDAAVLSAFNEFLETVGEIPASSRKALLLILRLVYHTGGRDALAENQRGTK